MNRAKARFKLSGLLILILLLSTSVFFTACNGNKDLIVDLENCQTAVKQSDLTGKSGVIADLQTVKQNQSVFAEYLKNDGTILIPQRESDSNVLAWQALGFTDGGVALFPIYLFNEVDKNQVDYEELIKDGSVLLSESERNYVLSSGSAENSSPMTLSVCYCVYVKNYVGKIQRIATVKSKFALYYFEGNVNYDNYVGRYETVVIPTSKYTLKSFGMAPMTYKDSRMDSYYTWTNIPGEPLPQEGVELGASFEYKDTFDEKVDEDVSLYDKDGFATLKINIPNYRKMGIADTGSTKGFISHEREGFDDYWGEIYAVTRYGDGDNIFSLFYDRGNSYMGVFYTRYRVQKDVSEIKTGLLIDELDLWGQAGEPSYNGGRGNYISMNFSCSQDLEEKSVTMASGTDSQSGYVSTSSYIVA